MLQDTAFANVVETEERAFKPKFKVKTEFIKPSWWNDEPRDNYRGECQKVVKSFLSGTLKKQVMNHKNFRHVYTTRNDGSELWMFKDNHSVKASVCIARKAKGMFIGNSTSLTFSKQNKDKKPRVVGGSQLMIQEILNQAIPMLPFQMFKESKLDINSVELIEKSEGEAFKFNGGNDTKEERHFTGAMVFKIDMNERSRGIWGTTREGTKDQSDYFLFDVDRNDISLKNLNFFLSKLSRPVTSVADAYASLKPKEVEDAERFLGHKCERQGEWFFIPVQGDFKKVKGRLSEATQGKKSFEARLHSKGNRPHFVEFLSSEGYVTGTVAHGGGEHMMIELKGWCKPVPNTAVESYKISGAID